jgi:aryl-alcohol dehydrogenase-like predicted oxidoreductase
MQRVMQASVPFFQGENLEKNKLLLARVAKTAEEKKCTTNQLALAWVIPQRLRTWKPILAL